MLLVDDDPTFLDTWERLLTLDGFHVACARTAAAGLELARSRFAVIVLDVRLASDNGLDVLRAIRREQLPGHLIVMTGFDIEGVRAEARRLGATFVDRWTFPDPAELVRNVLSSAGSTDSWPAGPVLTPPAATRWAEAVARGLGSSEDPRTLALWGREIGATESWLRDTCELARVPPKGSCDLVRVLRAVRLAVRSGRLDPGEWLDVGDRRTLSRLLSDGGIPCSLRGVVVEDILHSQRLVVNQTAVAMLGRALSRRTPLGTS